MAITIRCSCGSTYHLKDELEGQEVECPACKMVHKVLRTVFDYDKYLVNQKHLSLSEKYFVYDEAGKKILFVERPRHYIRTFLALFAGIAVWVLIFFIFLVFAAAFFKDSEIYGLITLIGILIGFIGAGFIFVWIIPFRHITIYEDDSKKKPLLIIRQDRKIQLLKATYTVFTSQSEKIAAIRKSFISDIFRKKWEVWGKDETLIFFAKEDSLVLALLRRVLGTFFGLLRTNFVFFDGTDNTKILGEFNRKITLLDKYTLDLTFDTNRKIDRRIAMALGILLDTGEQR